jgi:hypothetical protein
VSTSLKRRIRRSIRPTHGKSCLPPYRAQACVSKPRPTPGVRSVAAIGAFSADAHRSDRGPPCGLSPLSSPRRVIAYIPDRRLRNRRSAGTSTTLTGRRSVGARPSVTGLWCSPSSSVRETTIVTSTARPMAPGGARPSACPVSYAGSSSNHPSTDTMRTDRRPPGRRPSPQLRHRRPQMARARRGRRPAGLHGPVLADRP